MEERTEKGKQRWVCGREPLRLGRVFFTDYVWLLLFSTSVASGKCFMEGCKSDLSLD